MLCLLAEPSWNKDMVDKGPEDTLFLQTLNNRYHVRHVHQLQV